jgi:basic amino acid/polyamine antiporter, APA family
MLAAAFDRVMPEKFGSVSERFHVPSFSLMIFTIIALVLGAMYVFIPTVGTFTLDLIFAVVVMNFFTMVSATVMPYRRKALFQTSPAAKYSVGGIPLLTIFGALGLLFELFLIISYATIPALGVNSLPSAVFLVVVYAISFSAYFIAKAVRKKQGIDVSNAFRQIPPE